jgi:hypothetical protein
MDGGQRVHSSLVFFKNSIRAVPGVETFTLPAVLLIHPHVGFILWLGTIANREVDSEFVQKRRCGKRWQGERVRKQLGTGGGGI